MGDRGNIILKYHGNDKVYLHTHWSGSDLPGIIKAALKRGKDRWGDDPYLARILFSEMIQHEVMDNTGFGIAPYIGDGGTDILVDLQEKTVDGVPFEEYIK